MKQLLTILLFFISINSNATTYYVSNSGDDSNSGLTTVLAWQTLPKLNSFTFSPGDQILFKRGDTFYGKLIISQSGSSGNPITYGTYGFGDNPVITGFTDVTSWTNLGSSIWQSTSAVSSLTSCNMVVINGVNTPMGRTPNTGYWTYSTSTTTSLVSSSLNASTTNWTGAQAIIKTERYMIDKRTITSASGTTINYSATGGYSQHPNWGFFIQNDTRTLDQQNEWYYNPSSKKLSMYSTSTPTDVKLATADTLVYIVNKNYITFDGIDFTGANGQAFYLGNTSHLTIKNCDFNFNYNAIAGFQFGGSSSNFLIDSCSFNHTNNNAIDLPNEFAGATITNNSIQNTGILPGMAGSGQSRWGMSLTGNNYLAQYNKVDTTGYVAIGLNRSSITVSNNKVNYFCAITDDGGGIYTGNVQTRVVISGNIVLNGIGNTDGTSSTTGTAYGIYLDNLSSGMSVLNNSVGNIINAAIFLHQAKNIIITGNTTFNSRVGLFSSNDNQDTSYHTTGLTVKHNTFMAKTIGTIYTNANQLCINLASQTNDLYNYGSIDSNHYARPIDDSLTIWWTIYGVNDYKYSLSTWKTFSGYDAHSSKSPKSVTSADSLLFVYNFTDHDSTVLLPKKYIDMTNTSYDGSILLAPYTSSALIQNGSSSVLPPVVNAGPDQYILLPVSNTILGGTVTPASGHTATYLWTGDGTITGETTLTPTVSGLTSGYHTYTLTATQDDTQEASSQVQVRVFDKSEYRISNHKITYININ